MGDGARIATTSCIVGWGMWFLRWMMGVVGGVWGGRGDESRVVLSLVWNVTVERDEIGP